MEEPPKKNTKAFVITGIILVLALGIFFLIRTDGPTGNTVAVPQGPIHWHPHLTIKIDGEEQTIPTGIGIGTVHMPAHTHDAD